MALAHPAAFELVGMRPLRTSSALRTVEAGLATLRALGLDDEDAVRAYRVLVSFTRGFALGEIASFTLESAGTPSPPPAPVDPARFPHIAELGPLLGGADRDAAFAFGVETRWRASPPGPHGGRPAEREGAPLVAA